MAEKLVGVYCHACTDIALYLCFIRMGKWCFFLLGEVVSHAHTKSDSISCKR